MRRRRRKSVYLVNTKYYGVVALAASSVQAARKRAYGRFGVAQRSRVKSLKRAPSAWLRRWRATKKRKLRVRARRSRR